MQKSKSYHRFRISKTTEQKDTGFCSVSYPSDDTVEKTLKHD